MNEEYINMILDQINVAKYRDEYKKEYGYLNFEEPLRNSDIKGNRLRRELKK